MRVCVRVLPVGLAAAALLAPSALGAPPTPTWSAQQQLSPNNVWGDSPAAAVDSKGRTAVLWTSCKPNSAFDSCSNKGNLVYARSSSSTSSYGRLRTVARQFAQFPSVEISGDRAIGMWQSMSGHWATSSARLGGEWTKPTTTGPPAGGGAAVAENAAGKAVSAWYGTRTSATAFTGDLGLWASYRASRTGAWSTPRELRKKVAAGEPGVSDAGIPVIDKKGRASVITVAQGAGATDASGTVLVYDRRSNGRWARTRVSSSSSAQSPGASVGPGGKLVVAWQVCQGGFDQGSCQGNLELRTAYRSSPSGKFAASVKLADSVTFAPVVVVDNKNRAAVIYVNGGVNAAQSTNGTAWPVSNIDSRPLSDLGDGLAVAYNSKSQILLGYIVQQGQSPNQTQIANVAARNSAGEWGAAQQVGTTQPFNSQLDLAIGDTGRALATWTGGGNAPNTTIPVLASKARVTG